MNKAVAFIIAALLAGLTPLAAIVTNQPAPAFSVKSLEGKILTLSDLKGKIVVVNFWATWCPPCRAEIPDFVAVYDQFKSKGLEIVGISVDEMTPGQIQPFIDKYKMNYPVAMATAKILKDYGPISAIPTTFVVDKKGVVRFAQEGMLDKQTLSALFLKYSAEK